ncbi:hypothetical protein Mtai_v1c27260 (plasmid) [Meiothermus taiwanensis WR-220]|uniref:Uncharacterized protein n=1 Tax=Meiothermus taiwanensis WR-220 TaxID=1339250 RepID=A0A808U5M4_9DEIN|nr:hypothetical protein Mtai_v1c27260 [Meiothermus taiwanensis WR-220]
MKRAVGALDPWASSTRWMMRAMVLSEGSLSTRTVSTPSVLMEPANTRSPGPLLTGTDSPVTGESSRAENPLRMVPSAGTRPPGRTCTTCPTRRLLAGTSRVRMSSPSPSRRKAVLGAKAARALIPALALPAAMPSSSSPTANRNTTTAASGASPITTAPMAAMVTRVLMPKGLPSLTPAQALRASGQTPTSVAAT